MKGINTAEMTSVCPIWARKGMLPIHTAAFFIMFLAAASDVGADPCSNGYKRNETGVCVDVDECAGGAHCNVLAWCTNTRGSFTCSCPPGLLGNGKNCSTEAYAVCRSQSTPIHRTKAPRSRLSGDWAQVRSVYHTDSNPENLTLSRVTSPAHTRALRTPRLPAHRSSTGTIQT